jgi:hypothetical protein
MTTTTAPVYNHSHTHDHSTVVGYDVIRSTWIHNQASLEVTDVVAGGSNYQLALSLAHDHRRGSGKGRQWAYTTTRYACGCRWIATCLRPSGDNPAPTFTDHPNA